MGPAGGSLPYDYLIVATGARHSYFAHPEWESMAPGLKSIDDAMEIRNRFLMSFEEAEQAEDPATRREWQTFVVVGGGPTGVELAGMIPDVAKGIRRDFRRIDTRDTRVILLEGTDRILSSFRPSLAAHAHRDLVKLGVNVRTNALVTRIEPDAVYVGEERIATRTVFWAAGNQASPLLRSLGVPLDRAGRVPVEPDLSITGHAEIFVVGNAAAVQRGNGTLVPGVAPPAIQEGTHAADNILATLAGRPRTPFRYRNKGDLATIGRHRGIADFGFLRVTGYPAWLLWLFVHILYLAGFPEPTERARAVGLRVLDVSARHAADHAPEGVSAAGLPAGSGCGGKSRTGSCRNDVGKLTMLSRSVLATTVPPTQKATPGMKRS